MPWFVGTHVNLDIGVSARVIVTPGRNIGQGSEGGSVVYGAGEYGRINKRDLGNSDLALFDEEAALSIVAAGQDRTLDE